LRELAGGGLHAEQQAGRLAPMLAGWSPERRKKKEKNHQVTDRDFISKCNFLFCSVTIF